MNSDNTIDKVQIFIDVIAIIAFTFFAIADKDVGYGLAALWAFVALLAHIRLLNE